MLDYLVRVDDVEAPSRVWQRAVQVVRPDVHAPGGRACGQLLDKLDAAHLGRVHSPRQLDREAAVVTAEVQQATAGRRRGELENPLLVAPLARAEDAVEVTADTAPRPHELHQRAVSTQSRVRPHSVRAPRSEMLLGSCLAGGGAPGTSSSVMTSHRRLC